MLLVAAWHCSVVMTDRTHDNMYAVRESSAEQFKHTSNIQLPDSVMRLLYRNGRFKIAALIYM